MVTTEAMAAKTARGATFITASVTLNITAARPFSMWTIGSA